MADDAKQIGLELQKLEEEIAKLEARLKPITTKLNALKRKRRPLVAAIASRHARDKSSINQSIIKEYQAAEIKYGMVKKLAEQHGISTRHIQRILKSGCIKRRIFL
jgi:multidrug resistance efflux pump